eukprot:gene4737-5360_t
MPFIGQEWRSPGEIWVKTLDGWRTCRTIRIRNNNNEYGNSNNMMIMNGFHDYNRRQEFSLASASEQDQVEDTEMNNIGFHWKTKAQYIVLPGYSNRGPLFYFVSKRVSNQNEHHSTVGEAVQALELRRAVGDSRKFFYVCKLLDVLIRNDHLTFDCGSARRELKAILQEIVHTALETECNLHLAKQLVNLSKEQLLKEKHSCLSFHLGFEKRLQELTDLQGKLKRFKIKKLRKGITRHSYNITELPDECQRMILRCFTDHRDICSLAKVNRKFYKLSNDRTLWRDMCRFHLSKTQLEGVESSLYPDWKLSYKKLISHRYSGGVYFVSIIPNGTIPSSSSISDDGDSLDSKSCSLT